MRRFSSQCQSRCSHWNRGGGHSLVDEDPRNVLVPDSIRPEDVLVNQPLLQHTTIAVIEQVPVARVSDQQGGGGAGCTTHSPQGRPSPQSHLTVQFPSGFASPCAGVCS